MSLKGVVLGGVSNAFKHGSTLRPVGEEKQLPLFPAVTPAVDLLIPLPLLLSSPLGEWNNLGEFG